MGEVGEVVVTTFRKEGTPLLRYRTRDLSRLYPEPCACGSRSPRLGRILARSDDMVKVRGVMLYPAQVDTALRDVDGVTGEYQLHIASDPQERDQVLVRFEGAGGGLEAALAARLRDLTGIRIEVELVEPGTLPRSERKTQRVFDSRER